MLSRYPSLLAVITSYSIHYTKLYEEAETLIAALDGDLGEGELERALSRRDRARHLLKVASGADERKRAALLARLQRLHPRLEQLRKWRHWGSGNASYNFV